MSKMGRPLMLFFLFLSPNIKSLSSPHENSVKLFIISWKSSSWIQNNAQKLCKILMQLIQFWVHNLKKNPSQTDDFLWDEKIYGIESRLYRGAGYNQRKIWNKWVTNEKKSEKSEKYNI